MNPAAFAAALLDPAAPCPPGMVAWNGSDVAQRFAIHRNNVLVSLVEALADTFPVVHELVGGAFFRAMAADYVRRSPPRSPVLAWYGEGFPDFVADFPPAAGVPYLADVARLEYARVLAFHAADAEALPDAALTACLADPERLPALRLRLHPSLGVVVSAFAIVSLWAAHQGLEDIAAVDPLRPQCALVLRHELSVEVSSISQAAARFVDALGRGEMLGAAVAGAAEDDAAPFAPAPILGLLISRRMLVGFAVDPSAAPPGEPS